MKIIAYYTKDTIYKEYAERLKESCDNHNQEIIITEYDHVNRVEAMFIKPFFIYDQLKLINEPLIYLDCDSYLLSKIDIPNMNWDIGLVNNTISNKYNPKSNFISAYQPTENSFHFLNVWKHLCNERWINKRHDHIRLSWTRYILKDQYKEIDIKEYIKGRIIRDYGRRKGVSI